MVYRLPQTPNRWPWWDVSIVLDWRHWNIGTFRHYYDGWNCGVNVGPLAIVWVEG